MLAQAVGIPEAELARLAAAIKKEGERMEGAAARMLDAMASAAADSVQAYINRVIDRPTPFTRAACGYVRCRPGVGMFSIMYIKDIQSKYLSTMIEGLSVNAPKPAPATSQENQYGNLPRGALKKGRTFTLRVPGRKPRVLRVGKGQRMLVAVWTNSRKYKPSLSAWYSVAKDGIDKAYAYAEKQAGLAPPDGE